MAQLIRHTSQCARLLLGRDGNPCLRCAVQDGVVLGADTRSTSGNTVADKNCEKIHFIADNIRCCGAGTAADTEAVTSARCVLVICMCSLLRVWRLHLA